MAQRTGWSVANFALPDAGFVADGQGGHAFTYQVDRAQGANPRIIVIVGGIADTGFPDTRPDQRRRRRRDQQDQDRRSTGTWLLVRRGTRRPSPMRLRASRRRSGR